MRWILTLLLVSLLAIAPLGVGDAASDHSSHGLAGDNMLEGTERDPERAESTEFNDELGAGCLVVTGHCMIAIMWPIGTHGVSSVGAQMRLRSGPHDVLEDTRLSEDPPPPRA